jgi:hypothetical protein
MTYDMKEKNQSNHIKILGIASLLLFFVVPAKAQQANTLPAWAEMKNGKMVFKVDGPDFKVSPLTGVTRKHWKDAALYLLTGAFGYIHSMDDPLQFPKMPGKSYPRNPGQVPTEKLEGLVRTLFVASPLLREDPELVINQVRVAEYYRHQLVRLTDSSTREYIRHRAKNGGPSQILVEFGALSVSLLAAPEVLWEPLTAAQKNALASLMLSYGDGPTIGSNWKFFNIFILSFFKSKGYTVNEKLLVEYLDKSLQHYRGDGWYNDAPAYDYYSMWAFQMYGPFWAEFFGKKYYPEHARKFMDNLRDLKDNYPYLFGGDGKMIMWGRSMSYRIASIVPFQILSWLDDPTVNYGWARRISSSVLLQFFQHPEFMEDGVPTLGFYGAFEPAVQPYSCRGSVYWMGKAFIPLILPADDPFWTAVENEGAWKKEMKKGEVYNRYQDSSHILITNYPGIGASEVRAWCHVRAIGANEPFRSSENYNRLSYNSAFPWQADSIDGVVAMNYIIRNKQRQWEPFRLYGFKKFEDGVYYRDVVLETNPQVRFHLADIPLPNGILRVDRNNSIDSVELRLGHYALPQLDQPIRESTRTINGREIKIIDNGKYQLAMVPVKGWHSINTIASTGVHPESEHSKVINVSGKSEAGTGDYYITLMLWKESGKKWSKKELNPIQKITISDDKLSVQVILKNGNTKRVSF